MTYRRKEVIGDCAMIRSEVLKRLEEWAEYQDLDWRGWSSDSVTERARLSALRATRTDGAARWRGKVYVGRDYRGKAVFALKEAPSMPKETRLAAHSTTPAMWGDGPVDRMDRLLRDMESEGYKLETLAVILKARHPKRSTDDLAQYTGTTGRQFRRLRGRGIDWLCLWVGKVSV